MEFDEEKVDKIRDTMLRSGYSWSQANSLAVDIYLNMVKYDLEIQAAIDAIEKQKAIAISKGMISKKPVRKTQTKWRSVHANI